MILQSLADSGDGILWVRGATKVSLAALLLFPFLSEHLLGAGFYLPNQDALATAKGNAFVATADSAAAVHYNPAGLTQLQSPQAILGAYAIQLGNQARTDGTTYEPKSEWQLVPHLYYAYPLDDRVALGIGLNSPFGLGNDWGQETSFRTIGAEAYLSHPGLILALAYEFNDQLSVGGSLTINYVDLTLEQGLGAVPLDYLRFEGDGVSLSATLSLRWQPRIEHAFGIRVTSGTSHTLDGDLESSALPDSSAELDFRTPLRVAAGYSFRPTPRWNIEFNIEWLDWDSLNTLELKSPALSPGGTAPLVFNWQSNFIYELGFTYTTDAGYVLAAGYDYNENAEPDATFNPLVADANRHWLNAGIGRRLGNSMLTLAYQFGYSNRRVRNNPVNAAGQSANGRFESRHHAFVLSLRHSF